jgi:hypothetical protein
MRRDAALLIANPSSVLSLDSGLVRLSTSPCERCRLQKPWKLFSGTTTSLVPGVSPKGSSSTPRIVSTANHLRVSRG